MERIDAAWRCLQVLAVVHVIAGRGQRLLIAGMSRRLDIGLGQRLVIRQLVKALGAWLHELHPRTNRPRIGATLTELRVGERNLREL